MEKMISVRDGEKVNKIKTIMIVSLIAAIIMWIITYSNYMDEDNWKSVTIMPSLFQFYTSEYAIVEIYEMRLFYAGIFELIIVLCSSISLVRGKRCSLIITRDVVECVDKFGKQSTIPIKKFHLWRSLINCRVLIFIHLPLYIRLHT